MIVMRRVPQVSLVLRDLGVATSAASVMGIALFLRHFGSRVVDVVLAQVSQQQRDLGHPAYATGGVERTRIAPPASPPTLAQNARMGHATRLPLDC